MNTLEDALSFTMERAHATRPAMVTLSGPPYAWTWPKIAPAAFLDRILELEAQRVALARAEAGLSLAGASWNGALDPLLEDAVTGVRVARALFKEEPRKVSLFTDLRFRTAGREGRYRQALRFEKSWQKADAAWVFKPGLTLASFRGRRQALVDLEEAHVEAEREERLERATLHDLATTLHGWCVDWYEVATALFGEGTVPGLLVRTLPTTYDPNRPPGPLKLGARAGAAEGEPSLFWRADRGGRFYVSAARPGGGFALLADGVTEKRWSLRGLEPGLWRFQGHAENEFGRGAASAVVEVRVEAAKAA